MEAIGEQRADTAAGTDVSGLSAAALLRGRGLRSVPGAGFRSDALVQDAVVKTGSDGGAAAGFTARAGFATPRPGTSGLVSPGLATADMKASLALLDSAITAAQEELAAANFGQAADFADLAETLSRRIEHLQLLAATAVDRTRTEAINAAATASRAAGWTTGWGTGPEPAKATGTGSTTAAESSTAAAPAGTCAWSPADDGSRNTAEFLRTRLRISTSEARRRLALATAVLPRTGLAGRPMPPAHEETAAALTAGIISSRAGTIITTALDKVRHIPDPAAIAHMEHNLTHTAIENDHDFLTRIAHRWIDALDQDGTEPSEETLRHRQGVFLHHKRGGLHHLEVHATTDQFEVLTTIMNTATNPRTTTPNSNPEASSDGGSGCGGDGGGDGGTGSDCSGNGAGSGSAAPADLDAVFNAPTPEPDLDRRTLAQQRLDGLVGGCKAALAAGTLPTTGGLRPQVMVIISYQDLLNSIQTTANQGPRYNKTRPTNNPAARPTTIKQPPEPDPWQAGEPQPYPAANPNPWQTSDPGTWTGTGDAWPASGLQTVPDTGPGNTFPGTNFPGTALPGTTTGGGTFTYTGPITASTIRKIACDADIIPVLLGTEGRILDIGRTTRVFPPHIRKAITARDQGCAFPNCTIPAPWCEAHHITYWSQGGTTSTDNGVLLCTHHHHLIHKEQWKIHVKNGTPWFIPPPHIDPRQQPRQNHHHKT